MARPASGLHLIDLTALIVGYGMASVLLRAFVPSERSWSIAGVVTVGIVFAWLGLAMAGPVVLLLRRVEPDPATPDEPGSRSWAEAAWIVIGFYWTAMTILVVPVRMPGNSFVAAGTLGVFPILAALGLRWFGPKSLALRARGRSWTHFAAVGLLITWPFAWIGLIMLAKTFP